MVVFAEPRRAVLGMGTLAPANAEPEARIAVQNEVGQEDLLIRIEKGASNFRERNLVRGADFESAASERPCRARRSVRQKGLTRRATQTLLHRKKGSVIMMSSQYPYAREGCLTAPRFLHMNAPGISGSPHDGSRPSLDLGPTQTFLDPVRLSV